MNLEHPKRYCGEKQERVIHTRRSRLGGHECVSRVLVVRALKSSYVNSGLVSFVPVRKSELTPSYHCKLSKADAIKTGKLGLIFLSSLGIIKPPQTSSP